MIPLVEITEARIDTARVIGSAGDPGAGATAVFVGTTRDNSHGKVVRHLEYEAYRPMAIRQMTTISENAAGKWPLLRVSIVHRTGRVDVGDASVVIAVSCAHRAAAFEACRYLIDTLKKEVPIWKKEVYADGHSWSGMEGEDRKP